MDATRVLETSGHGFKTFFIPMRTVLSCSSTYFRVSGLGGGAKERDRVWDKLVILLFLDGRNFVSIFFYMDATLVLDTFG